MRISIIFTSILLLGFSFFLFAQQSAMPDHVAITPGQVQWGPAPPGIPAGGKMAVLEGDPSIEGQPFTLMVSVPDGYEIKPHWHPTREHLVILKGTFNIGMGDTLDKTKSTALSPGSFTFMDANMHHYAWTKGQTEFVVYGVGPFAINYVNAADEHRRT